MKKLKVVCMFRLPLVLLGVLVLPATLCAQGTAYGPAGASTARMHPDAENIFTPMPAQPGDMQYAATPMRYAPPATVRDFSWTYIDQPTDRAFKVNDIVTVLVSERSEVTLNSRFNRQRNASFKSELKEFIKLDGFAIENSASTSPTIDTNQQERIQSTGQVTDQEGITYRIAATIVDIRPNGNLVLEARKKINANDDLWEYTLHGEVRYEDVLRNNTVLSENIANLNIEKRLQGRVHSSTGRRWGNKMIDMFWPF